MPAYRKPLRRKKQSLGYLCEDLNKQLSRLRDWNDEGQIDQEMLDQAARLIAEICGLDLGIESRLNTLQYCFGEMRIHLLEGTAEYLKVDECIAQIQEFLDWGL